MDENTQQNGDNPSTVIGSDIEIIGNLNASGDLKIEGNVDGDVRCRTLILGEGGTIKGNVICQRARVSGAVNGSIEAADLAIEATGVMTGEATYGRLKVAIGGIIEGTMKCKREADQQPKAVNTEPVGDLQSKSTPSQGQKRKPSGLFGGPAPNKT